MRKPKAKIRPALMPTGSQRPDEDYFFLNPQYRGGPSTFPFDVLGEPDLGHWKWVALASVFCAFMAVLLPIAMFRERWRFELWGIETPLAVTDCKVGGDDSRGVELTYTYEINDTLYRNTDSTSGRSVTCEDFPIGMILTGRYLSSDPSRSQLHDNRAIEHSLFEEIALSIIWIALWGFCTVVFWREVPLRKMRRYWHARRRYRRLLDDGVIIDGTLTAIHAEMQQNGVYAIEAQYQAHDPITWAVVTGTQRHNRDDLTPDDLPPPGTPVQIMYADSEAHFML